MELSLDVLLVPGAYRWNFCTFVPWIPGAKVTSNFRSPTRIIVRQYDHGLTQLMHDNLHWLDVPERVKYKAVILTHRCLIGTALQYLAADYFSFSDMAQRCHLHSAAGHQLFAQPYRLTSCRLRVFFVLGLRLWNSLPRLLHDSDHSTTSF